MLKDMYMFRQSKMVGLLEQDAAVEGVRQSQDQRILVS